MRYELILNFSKSIKKIKTHIKSNTVEKIEELVNDLEIKSWEIYDHLKEETVKQSPHDYANKPYTLILTSPKKETGLRSDIVAKLEKVVETFELSSWQIINKNNNEIITQSLNNQCLESQ